MREIVRRVVVAICLYGGIALCLTPARDLFQIEPVDWLREVGERQQHSENIKGMMSKYVGEEQVKDIDLASKTRGKIADYIAYETEGRLIVVSGTSWEGLWNDIEETVTDKAPSKAWAAVRGLEYHSNAVYLPRTAPLFQQVNAQWPDQSLLAYIRIDPEDSKIAPRYLSVYEPSPSDLRDAAPTHILYPHRTYGALILFGGLLFYIFLPRARPTESGVFYLARAAGWLPDLLAAFGSGAFFAMPFLITSDSSGGPLDRDWWPLTVIMWSIGAIFASIFVITAWYQTRRLTWDDNGICIETWGFTRRNFPLDEIEGIGSYIQQMPQWLRVLAWVISIFNWRATTSAILLDQADPGFSISLSNGTRYSFTGQGLWGANSLVAWCDAHNIPVEPAVRPLMESKPDFQPSKAGRVVSIIFAVIALVGTGWPLMHVAVGAMPQPEPKFRSGSFDAQEDFGQLPSESKQPVAPPVDQPLAASKPPVTVTPEMLAAEQEIIQQIQKVRDEIKTLKSQIGTVANPNEAAIDKSLEAVSRLRELQKQLEAVRSGKLPEKSSVNAK
ncbi:DUF898 domain-containing protein [Gimesia panareensis]|uniref:DUF898 domain-containing protein n=1 Tax=Gimesia panareensis TaxID=2527978 RepID=UPI001189AAB9|nr:DUF898 domain-containing protein [Gimesia panareensis]QDU50740.1 hypothetical protein Pan110_30980 [Gimesia panareensis]